MGVLRNMYGPDIPEPVSVMVPRWSELSSFRLDKIVTITLMQIRLNLVKLHFLTEVRFRFFLTSYCSYLQIQTTE